MTVYNVHVVIEADDSDAAIARVQEWGLDTNPSECLMSVTAQPESIAVPPELAPTPPLSPDQPLTNGAA